MFVYEKKLQYPVKIKNVNPKLATIIIPSTAGQTSINYKKQRESLRSPLLFSF